MRTCPPSSEQCSNKESTPTKLLVTSAEIELLLVVKGSSLGNRRREKGFDVLSGNFIQWAFNHVLLHLAIEEKLNCNHVPF